MTRERVIVLGAGLSGLAAGSDLLRGGADVAVLEAGERAGGVVGTFERGGFRFERGPNTVPASAAEFRRLCGDLGIAGRLIATPAAASERYLFVRGRLRALPRSPVSFLASSILSPRGRLRAARELFRRFEPPGEGDGEPTLEAFLAERLGAEATRVLAGSFVRGVYAAELADLGARSAFPRMWEACAAHGGLVRGLIAASRERLEELPGPRAARSALLSFPLGLQELVDALARSLGERLRTRTAAAALECSGSGWLVRTREGERLEASRVVLAVPAPVAAGLLAGPLDPLRAIRHARVTVVHLGVELDAARGLPLGFGFLVPPGEQDDGAPRALGTLFASNLFPGRAPEGCAALSSFYSSAEVQDLRDGELASLAAEDLSRALRLGAAPPTRVAEVRRFEDVIPRYAPGHARRMQELLATLRSELPGLHLAGSFVAGVSVEQVIARGRAVAAEILR